MLFFCCCCCFVVRDLCRSACRGNFVSSLSLFPSPLSLPRGCFSVPTQNSLSQQPAKKTFHRCLDGLIVPWKPKTNSQLRKIGCRSSFSGFLALNLSLCHLGNFFSTNQKCILPGLCSHRSSVWHFRHHSSEVILQKKTVVAPIVKRSLFWNSQVK